MTADDKKSQEKDELEHRKGHGYVFLKIEIFVFFLLEFNQKSTKF